MQTSTTSASTVVASPPFAGSTVSTTPAPPASALVTFMPSWNFMPCLVSERWSCLVISSSTPGVMRSRNSITVTSAPSRHRAELEADDAGADHDHAPGHRAELERAGRGDDLLLVDRHARQRDHLRARGDQDVLRGERILDRAVVADDRDRARLLDAAGALERG